MLIPNFCKYLDEELSVSMLALTLVVADPTKQNERH